MEWNSLPLEVHAACSVDKFKAKYVIKFVTKWFIISFSEVIAIFITFYKVICFYNL